MKTITIIKIAAYDPTMSGQYSMYRGYCLSTLQEIQPHIKPVERTVEPKKGTAVLCSTLTRSQETALLLRPRPKPTKLLNEIRFDLGQLLSEREFNAYGSSLVRERFVQAFTEDSLLEQRVEVIRRVRALLGYLSSLEEGDILCVSHSFFMKVLEAYIKTGGELERRSELLANFISTKRHTYPYMEGFDFEL